MRKDMIKNKKKIYFSSPLLVIYLYYVLFVLVVEWIYYLAYQFSLTLPIGMAELVAFGALTIFIYKFRTCFHINTLKINAEMIVGLILIFLYGILVSVYPDKGFDTYNYHIIAQTPYFENYFAKDFGYGNFQVWGFRLADRLFFYFRLLLGFRYGTLLNTVILMISYIQLYTLLPKIFSNFFAQKRIRYGLFYNRMIWSMAILLPLDTILMYGTYYVDLFALPIEIELLRLILEKRDENTSIDIAYFALLNGFCLAFKLTNIIYVFPYVIIFVVLNIRCFKIKDWFFASICGASPSMVYLLHNWLCTKNPVFPYFNSLFRSPYFPETNFKDTRWGGSNFFEKIFWIFYAAFHGEYRQCEIYDKYPVLLQISLIGIIFLGSFYLIRWIKKRILPQRTCILILCISISSTIIWSFTVGYSRYFIFGKILWGIIAFMFLLEITTLGKRVGEILSGLCLTSICICLGLNVASVVPGRNWSWTKYNYETFKDQLEYVLKDRDYRQDYLTSDDSFVITSQEYFGIAELTYPELSVFNAAYSSYIPESDWDARFRQYMEDGAGNYYDIHKRNFPDISDYIDKLNMNSLYVNGVLPLETDLGTFELVSVKKCEDKINSVWISDEQQINIETNNLSGVRNLSFIGGRYYNWGGALGSDNCKGLSFRWSI